MAGTAAARRLKKQRQKEKRKHEDVNTNVEGNETGDHTMSGSEGDESITFVSAPIVEDEELMKQFSGVISVFSKPREEENIMEADHEAAHDNGSNDSDASGDEDQDSEQQLSKKKLKRLNRIKLADLKQYARHPEVVEWEDVTAKNPKLLVELKSVPHSVPVPRHWIQKRKYLSGKRGFVKPPFELPSFIRDTGVLEMREAIRAQDATKRTKVKAREKMRPKMGRMNVDYERLYDAFFKYQTKPPLTAFGDLYYEGKEFEAAKGRKPGLLSEELRGALGMTSHLIPPPWLISMQKYGPPPSYPHMRIPGLNAPIPEGAQWGYHPGGWGKPPLDHLRDDSKLNRSDDPVQLMLLNPIERNIWGELEPEEEEEEAYEETTEQQDTELTLDETQLESFQVQEQLRQAKTSSSSHTMPIRELESRETLSVKRK